MTDIASAIGPEVCKALPGLRAFTGCESTSAFVRKEKKKPLTVMRSSSHFLRVFAELGYVPTELPESLLH